MTLNRVSEIKGLKSIECDPITDFLFEIREGKKLVAFVFFKHVRDSSFVGHIYIMKRYRKETAKIHKTVCRGLKEHMNPFSLIYCFVNKKRKDVRHYCRRVGFEKAINQIYKNQSCYWQYLGNLWAT